MWPSRNGIGAWFILVESTGIVTSVTLLCVGLLYSQAVEHLFFYWFCFVKKLCWTDSVCAPRNVALLRQHVVVEGAKWMVDVELQLCLASSGDCNLLLKQQDIGADGVLELNS